jgi:hypothetical protein
MEEQPNVLPAVEPGNANVRLSQRIEGGSLQVASENVRDSRDGRSLSSRTSTGKGSGAKSAIRRRSTAAWT